MRIHSVETNLKSRRRNQLPYFGKLYPSSEEIYPGQLNDYCKRRTRMKRWKLNTEDLVSWMCSELQWKLRINPINTLTTVGVTGETLVVSISSHNGDTFWLRISLWIRFFQKLYTSWRLVNGKLQHCFFCLMVWWKECGANHKYTSYLDRKRNRNSYLCHLL